MLRMMRYHRASNSMQGSTDWPKQAQVKLKLEGPQQTHCEGNVADDEAPLLQVHALP